MNGMYNKLPRCVYLKNERFIINTDYRIFIEYEWEIMQGEDTKKSSLKALQSFYPAFSLILQKGLLEEAIDKFVWFYKCGKDKPPKKSKGKGNNKRAFDYKEDDLLIWGAFKTYFKVDLSTNYLHWWKFKALWETLPQEAEFTKIKGYRTYTGKDKDILELQEYYSLGETKAEIEDRIRRDKIYESLK